MILNRTVAPIKHDSIDSSVPPTTTTTTPPPPTPPTPTAAAAVTPTPASGNWTAASTLIKDVAASLERFYAKRIYRYLQQLALPKGLLLASKQVVCILDTLGSQKKVNIRPNLAQILEASLILYGIFANQLL